MPKNSEMLSREIKQAMQAIVHQNLSFDQPMSAYTSLRVGGPADAVAAPPGVQELIALVRLCRSHRIPYQVIGAGTNLLVHDSGIAGVVLMLKDVLDTIEIESSNTGETRLKVGAGVPLRRLCALALKKGWSGLNWGLGIPGTVGGAIHMNAGTSLGTMADSVLAIDVIAPERVEAECAPLQIRRNGIPFSYRGIDWHQQAYSQSLSGPIVTGAKIQLGSDDPIKLKREAVAIMRRRTQQQPLGQASAGCIFKNPANAPAAGYLIEQAGLKGRAIGGAQVSVKHANFIINTGQATASDIMQLMTLVQAEVARRFDISLEPEVHIIGA
jgi:UDP-N-acetylmuramate dehydrogenase